METTKSTATLLILALLATTIAQPMEKAPDNEPPAPSKTQFSPTRTASCLVKVTADPSVMPLSIDTIQHLFYSSAVAGKAADEVLGITSLRGTRPFDLTIEQLDGPAGGYGGGMEGYGGGMMGGMGGYGRSTSASRRSTRRPIEEQPPQPQQERGKTAPTTSARRPTTSSSPNTHSSSSTRPSSNQPISYGYSSSPKTPPTSTQPNPFATSPATTSRYSSTSDPLSNQTPYHTSSRTTSAYRNPATGGSYGGSYSRGSSNSTGDPYDAGSSLGYYSSYSRTARTPTTRTTGRSAAATRPASQTQTIFCRLQVDITEDSAKPAAREFMNALVVNLRDVLESALREYGMSVESDLEYAERRRDLANAQLSKIMAQAQPKVSIPAVESDPANLAIKDQLDETVDLSALEPTMPFAAALEEIKNAVDPPLTIVVFWRDIYDNADVEQTTETNFDGIPKIRLRNALDLLLKAVAGSFSDGLGYSIDNGVITIATQYSIPREMITVVYDVPGLVYSGSTATALADVIIRTIEPESWLQNEDGSGDGEITPYLGNKLAVRQTADVHTKIKKFMIDTLAGEAPLAIPPDLPPETFLYEKQELQRQKLSLEMDVARFKARRTAIQQAVAKISVDVAQKLDADPVTAELEKILKINATILAAAKTRYESGTISGAEIQQVEEKLARARIEIAKRREELSNAAGGYELAKFNSELTSLSIELAERTAELQILNTQLGQTESQLAMATTINPQLSELRYAKEVSDAAQKRVSQLRTRLANLTHPTITLIGAD